MATLKDIREGAFLSQKELAERAGLTEATVNRLEKSRHKPIFKTIRKLAEALGVAPGEIEFP